MYISSFNCRYSFAVRTAESEIWGQTKVPEIWFSQVRLAWYVMWLGKSNSSDEFETVRIFFVIKWKVSPQHDIKLYYTTFFICCTAFLRQRWQLKQILWIFPVAVNNQNAPANKAGAFFRTIKFACVVQMETPKRPRESLNTAPPRRSWAAIEAYPQSAQ